MGQAFPRWSTCAVLHSTVLYSRLVVALRVLPRLLIYQRWGPLTLSSSGSS